MDQVFGKTDDGEGQPGNGGREPVVTWFVTGPGRQGEGLGDDGGQPTSLAPARSLSFPGPESGWSPSPRSVWAAAAGMGSDSPEAGRRWQLRASALAFVI